MRIIGCDLHARQQTLAMLDTTTGEMVNLTLMHGGNEVKPDPTSRRASWPTFRSAIAHDAPKSGAGHGPDD